MLLDVSYAHIRLIRAYMLDISYEYAHKNKQKRNTHMIYSLVYHLSMLNLSIPTIRILINIHDSTSKRRLDMCLLSPTGKVTCMSHTVRCQTWREEWLDVGIPHIT